MLTKVCFNYLKDGKMVTKVLIIDEVDIPGVETYLTDLSVL